MLALLLGVVTLGPMLATAQTATTLGQAGDVKIHDITDAISDTSDNPMPCDPVLVAFNFTLNTQYTYEFLTQPGGDVVIGPITVTVTTDPQQEPASGDFRPPLVAGESYKLVWDFGASIGNGPKSKVFSIPSDCPANVTTTTVAPTTTTVKPTTPAAVTITPKLTG